MLYLLSDELICVSQRICLIAKRMDVAVRFLPQMHQTPDFYQASLLLFRSLSVCDNI